VAAIAEHHGPQPLRGHVQLDDADLGGRRPGAGCFAGVIDAGCAHAYTVVGARKPRDLLQFTWIKTVLGNLKAMVGAAHKSFDFGKYAAHQLGSFACRFNRRFDLQALPHGLMGRAATSGPTREHQIRGTAQLHD